MSATVVEYTVAVVDGEGMPVPGATVGARYHYPTAASTWDTATTDGDGVARLRDQHAEAPTEVVLSVDDELCGTYPLENGAHIVAEM